MGDDRRNDGGGAVVAVIVILGIVGLLGALVVFGGAFFFLASHSDVQVATQVMPMPTPTPPTAVMTSGDLEEATGLKPELAGGVAEEPARVMEVDEEGNIRLTGLILPEEDLKESLTELKKQGISRPITLKVGSSPAALKQSRELIDLLAELDIPFEMK